MRSSRQPFSWASSCSLPSRVQYNADHVQTWVEFGGRVSIYRKDIEAASPKLTDDEASRLTNRSTIWTISCLS